VNAIQEAREKEQLLCSEKNTERCRTVTVKEDNENIFSMSFAAVLM
jgi:hypothetical protein